ncbi:MAG: HAD family hydrolase [Burkholderiales bacterium]|nr:haloacid dehalogenase-like hydrolase [Burkholderiales bacterium]
MHARPGAARAGCARTADALAPGVSPARRALLALAAAAPFGAASAQPASGDPLPSWHDGSAKARILAFVEAVSKQDGPDFVPPAERVAVFDNDGTLWAEQPVYVQAFFVADRVRAMAATRPEWRTKEPYASLLRGDLRALAAGGEKGLAQLVMATHAGMSAERFAGLVEDWIATARHPKTGRPFTEMVYAPMLELIAHLHASGFGCWIVSGGGIEFMRPWTERVYGIPPERVIGSSVKTRFELRDGVPTPMRLPEIDFIDDKAGKPVGIHRHVGRRPIAAFGNSDGDLQMLQWTAAGLGARLAAIVRYTDAEREWAYDRTSKVGRLDRALDEADARGWTVVDIRRDWRRVFPFEPR